ncbi:DUF4148 domain-containing protein [Paraburkholderia pallida]|uniref:DUF4148 domain-containing protein n=1 Tax=Paraburkholderia pallida TaxID=2547399 RepID=A0A4P7D8P8_9BURK|nr:DUF4148 domain-containing protein [Paraburkholderia pallida]
MQCDGVTSRASKIWSVAIVKTLQRTAILALLSVVACPAFASSKLTAAQCRDYPFVRSAQPPSHQQLQNELRELESVGYSPASGDANDYPYDLQSAQQRLQAKYQRDCGLSGNGTIAASTGSSGSLQQ